MNESSEQKITPVVELQTRRIPHLEMLRSMTDVELTEAVSQEDLSTFLEENCEGVRIGNTDVIFVSQDHANTTEVNPTLELIAGASGTKIILVEYFKPELEANARNFPVLGKYVHKLFEASEEVRTKTALSSILARIAKEKKKSIAVADIANKAEYYYGYSLALGGLFLGKSIFPALWPVAITYASMYGVNRFHEFFLKQGFFDPESIHKYEQIMLDTEDARRVFVAMGIQQLAREYQPKASEPSRILACYPKAHSMRIINYLSNPEKLFKITKKAKQYLYKLYPALDISVRQYQHRDSLARLSGNQAFEGWQQVSNESL